MPSPADADFLRASDLFENQPEEVVGAVIAQGDVLEFGPGDVVFRQGDKGDRIFIVKEGVLEILAQPSDGAEAQAIAYLGKGEVLGEIALLTGSPRSATARSPERAELFTIEKAVFLDLMGTLPAFARNLCIVLAKRLETTTLKVPRASGKQLQGNLRYFDLATVIQTLIGSHQTGTLVVTLEGSKAKLAEDQARLARTEIHAPFAGRLGRSQVHEGALITVAGTAFNTLIQLDPIYATFNPSETDLSRISQALARGPVTAEVLLSDDSGPHLSGKLSFLDNTVDRATGTITARITLDNPGGNVLPGQYARVRLHVADLKDALVVPQAALGSSQIGKFVYVMGADNKADQRYLSLGPTEGDLVVVTKGLTEGDRIITGNLQKLSAGKSVRPTS
jgi:CRP-like cAMP-binding protein